MPFVHACALASSRRHSEDRVEVFERAGELVAVVADGAGGMRGGAAASDALIDAVRSAMSAPLFEPLDERTLVQIFHEVDASLASRMIGETTGVVVVIGAEHVVGVSVGDSEAWVIGDDGSVDDLTADQMKPRLGSGRATPVAFRRGALEGVLAIGTDGLFKNASADRIAAVACMTDTAAAADGLVNLVRLPSGAYPDDVGVLVLRSRRVN